jgi:hypothetical protein
MIPIQLDNYYYERERERERESEKNGRINTSES